MRTRELFGSLNGEVRVWGWGKWDFGIDPTDNFVYGETMPYWNIGDQAFEPLIESGFPKDMIAHILNIELEDVEGKIKELERTSLDELNILVNDITDPNVSGFDDSTLKNIDERSDDWFSKNFLFA